MHDGMFDTAKNKANRDYASSGKAGNFFKLKSLALPRHIGELGAWVRDRLHLSNSTEYCYSAVPTVLLDTRQQDA